MIRLFRFACMSGLGGTTITIAASRRCHSATGRHRDARHSVSSIPTMRAQQGRTDATGVTAALIELIERPADMLTRNTSPFITILYDHQCVALSKVLCSHGFYSPLFPLVSTPALAAPVEEYS